jgi:hypothetical protein
MLVGAVPNHGSSAERAGIAYGDEVRTLAFDYARSARENLRSYNFKG